MPLRPAAAALLFASACLLPPACAADPPPSADDAIRLLQQGNARFVAGKSQHPHEKADHRLALEAGQHPFAVVIGCSDSRVPPELIFDQGLGDLFVVRVAGNVVDTDVAASVEYAVAHLKTKLVVVVGHTHCGAVTATLDHLTDAEGEPAEVVSLLFQIEPATMGLPAGLSNEQRIEHAVRRNIELAVRRLSRIPSLHRCVRSENVRIVGAVYDMHTGKVGFLPAEPSGALEPAQRAGAIAGE